jgi:hypothetical protein
MLTGYYKNGDNLAIFRYHREHRAKECYQLKLATQYSVNHEESVGYVCLL